MVSSSNMLIAIKHVHSDCGDTVVVDGVKYVSGDLFAGVKIEATECHLATIHGMDGILKHIIYYYPQDDGSHSCCIINNVAYFLNYGVIDLRKYITAIPNIERLYDGDLDTITRVKRAIDAFHANKQLFDNAMMESIEFVPLHKACKN